MDNTAHDMKASENRTQRRRRTMLGGEIILRDGDPGHKCTVRDLSDGGARLDFRQTDALPDRFILAFGQPVRRVIAKVAWRSATAIGVSFESEATRD